MLIARFTAWRRSLAMPKSKSGRDDKNVEAKKGKRWNRSVQRIPNPDARDHREKHHCRQATSGELENSTMKVPHNQSKAPGNLQHSCEHAKTGEAVTVEFRHHCF